MHAQRHIPVVVSGTPTRRCIQVVGHITLKVLREDLKRLGYHLTTQRGRIAAEWLQ